jgi:hypothetical protein
MRSISAYLQACCGYIDSREIAAATDRVFDRFKDQHGYIPASKLPEAAKAVFLIHGGQILPVSCAAVGCSSRYHQNKLAKQHCAGQPGP